MELIKRLSLLIVSDVHGYIYPTNYSDHIERNLGLAKVSSVIKQLRKEKATILINNGDLIQGSPLTYYHAKYCPETENPTINVINDLGCDVSVLGNHEFNYGTKYLQRAVNQSNHPWLSANVLDKHTKEPAFGQPYLIKQVDGLRVALLGITTHYIPNWEDPNHIKDLQFDDALTSAKQWVNYIRQHEQPDIVVVCYHGGFERDLETGEPTEDLTGENQGYQICKEVEGIDVFVTGHQHRSIAKHLFGIPVLQPSHNGQLLGELELAFHYSDGKWTLKETKPRLHEIDADVEMDHEVLARIQKEENDTQAWLDRPIGSIEGDMSIDHPFEVRIKDHPFIEFINNVQMEAANVSISNTSLFNNASPGFNKKVTMRDIVSNYVYPNTLKVIRISGQAIKDALEQSATYFIINENGELDIHPAFMEPKPQHYNYDMWEGIEYELTISNPIGQRVTKLFYQGEPIDYKQEFDVVMNNYRAGGGGNFAMYKEAEVIQEIQTDMTELIANYILERKTIKATCNHNWQVKV
ncbi:bifunctional metallophosphatase/5'-nucleotidase [Aquibacillus albus]|uniref:2',3'-cyclic-nucleotide 2'-phosphodiesterase (5'-nucleotidase family) n=1 Tax=Aquibacillus albus TaxID=1168171 RepID=A0ABS2MXM2_9BACI|nr:bifunctional UDP-sugar hydrolase/5'-nucleotidase [Aquibacillus albus]MBM7570627.1 2',3'-cyclic-nucleotide 2'-phosphodiesterase (5'-nucleotidase family) [Aquibacillus albus]